MTNKIDVLNNGFVRLVDSMGNDLSVVRSARVSYDAEWREGGDDAKLINYLWKNKHTSPFESVHFTFEVKAPIFVLRQWHRHRTWKYNEVSARYTELPEEYYLPDLEQITTQSKSNKQMRTGEQHAYSNLIRHSMEICCDEAFKCYKDLINLGCPRELARGVLPVNTYSRMFATVDLHNLLHFIQLRVHEHAQYEIRVYAQAMLDLIRTIVPITIDAFERN